MDPLIEDVCYFLLKMRTFLASYVSLSEGRFLKEVVQLVGVLFCGGTSLVCFFFFRFLVEEKANRGMISGAVEIDRNESRWKRRT